MPSREVAGRSVLGQASAGAERATGLGPEATPQGCRPQVIPQGRVVRTRSEQQPGRGPPGGGCRAPCRAVRRRGRPPPWDQTRSPGGSLFKHQGSKLFRN